MRLLRATSCFPFALRGLLLAALLAIAPLCEAPHDMAGEDGTVAAMSHFSTHDLFAGATSDQKPISHGRYDAGCRILCFGWVDVVAPEQHEGQVSGIALVLPPVPATLLDGIAPAPSGHPPKPGSFV